MVRSRAPFLFLIAAAPLAPAPAAPARDPGALLAGRVAGAPVECVPQREVDRGTQLFNNGAIVFKGRGGTWYVNTPPNCAAIKSNRAITTVTSDRLCRGDLVQISDPPSPVSYGACALGQFTPYRRAGK